MTELIKKIADKIKKEEPTNRQAYADLYQILRELLKTNEELSIQCLIWLSEKCFEIVPCPAQSIGKSDKTNSSTTACPMHLVSENSLSCVNIDGNSLVYCRMRLHSAGMARRHIEYFQD